MNGANHNDINTNYLNNNTSTHNDIDNILNQSNEAHPNKKVKTNEMNNQHLTIGTLNTRSLQDNIGYINIAALKTSILFINETKSTKQLVTDEIIYLNNKKVFSKNAVRQKKTGNSSGGLAFIVDSNLKCKVKFLSNRIGQLLLNKLCLIGVYLTCNNNHINSLIDFEAELELIFQTVKNRQKEGYECLILGDFNVDLNKHSTRSNLLQNYLNTFRYELKDQKHEMSVDYTYEMIRTNKKSKKIEIIHSFVDHVACPAGNSNITYIDVIEELGNNSDHNMILFKYILTVDTQMDNLFTKPKKEKTHFNWADENFLDNYRKRITNKLNESNYKYMLKELQNSKQKDKSSKLIDETHKELQRIIIDCANKAHNELNLTIRSARMHKRRLINYWWNDELKEIYEKMKSTYIDYKNSNYAEEFRTSYLEQKKLFKLQKKFNIQLKRNKTLKLINDMFKTNKTNFWRKVKKLQTNSTQIDAKLEEINNDYKKLFNERNKSNFSKESEAKEKVEKLLNDYKTNESNECPISDSKMKFIIKDKIKALSNNKAIGITGLSNEMLKYGLVPNEATDEEKENDILIESIAIIYKAMICNQHVPPLFNVSIIKPLVKDCSKDTDNIGNLRGIAISDTIQNLYESVLEDTIRNEIKTDNKQMGFKSNNSCAHAIMVLKQTMNVARKFGHRLYIAAIDAAKAFDKVNRDILWSSMLKIGVSPIIVLAVLKYYEKSMMMVQLDDEFSKPFYTTVGVRQGGVLSPLLFSIYINEILEKLQELNIGYKVGNIMVDVLAYADDLLIITKSKLDLQIMLQKLSNLGNELEIKFNATKSMYMVFNKYHHRTVKEQRYDEWNGELLLAGSPIERVESFKYLGAMIHDSGRCRDHLEKRRKAVLAAVAKITTIGLCNDIMNIKLKAEMFKTHVRPIIMYAIENFDLNGGDIRKVKSAEGNALKRLIGIPTRCKSTDLFLSFGMMPSKERIEWSKLNHYKRMCSNEFTNEFLNEIDKLGVQNSLIQEVKEFTKNVPNVEQFTLKDKCEIRILDLEDEQEEREIKSKTCQLLKIIYDMNDKCEMKNMIFELIKFD